MAAWLGIDPLLHQAAIAGKVVDAQTKQAVVGVAVAMQERPDRIFTARDGCFCFADLPDGKYTLSFSIPETKWWYGEVTRIFTVARDAAGRIPMRVEVVELPPTAIEGQIQDAAAAPIVLARVRVAGSGERARSNADGRFYLPFVEPGARRLEISASGYGPVTKMVNVVVGEIAAAGPFTLEAVT